MATALKFMDQQLIRQLLQNEEDIITPEIKAEEALYRNTRCPLCGQGGCEKRLRAPKIVLNENKEPVVVSSPFGMGMLPEGYAHCIHCGTDFNPHTGLVFKTDASMIHAPR